MSTKYYPPTGTGARKSTVESLAKDLAGKLQFKPGDSLDELVAATGGKIVIGPSGVEDHDSGSIIAKSLNDYTIYLSQNTSRLRDRFTIAHELGHLVLHFPQIRKIDSNAVMRATRWVDDTDEGKKRAEWEANWFAAAFLMPEDQFKDAWQPTKIDEVALLFDVSPSAASIRARSLGLS